MSAELAGILSVGAALLVGLGGLTLALWRDVRADVHALSARVDGLGTRVDALAVRVDALATRVDGLSDRVARLEGVVEGVVVGRSQRDD